MEFLPQYKGITIDCKCGNDADFIWKTRHGKKTKIHGFYRWLESHQLQVQCKRCGSKMYITWKLLGMAPKKRFMNTKSSPG